MNLSSRITLAAGTLTVAGILAGCTSTGMDDMPGMSHSSQAPTSTHNAQDVMFAQMMIVHHQGAIEMADLASSRAASGTVKSLAAKIKVAQQPEIDRMTSWLKAWGEPIPMPGTGSARPSTSHDMSGMDMSTPTPADGPDVNSMPGMTAVDMARLKAATDAEFDKKFLSLMIEHHQGAIEMAKQEQSGGKDSAAKKLADSIVSAQSSEITEMKSLLASLD